MEINITQYVRETEHGDISASAAELGPDAGRITWENAKREAPMLATEDQLGALRSWALDSGGWNHEEVAAWDEAECNALFCQLVSGDWRELESLASDDNGDIDWARARELSEAGTIGWCLFRGDIPGSDGYGQIFYYLGS